MKKCRKGDLLKNSIIAMESDLTLALIDKSPMKEAEPILMSPEPLQPNELVVQKHPATCPESRNSTTQESTFLTTN